VCRQLRAVTRFVARMTAPAAKLAPMYEPDGSAAVGGPAHGVMQGLPRLALEALPSGGVVIDGGGTIVLVNRQIEQQFDYTAQDRKSTRLNSSHRL